MAESSTKPRAHLSGLDGILLGDEPAELTRPLEVKSERIEGILADLIEEVRQLRISIGIWQNKNPD